MAFPTSSFTPVESVDDSAFDAVGGQSISVTVPSSCKTLIACLSNPSQGTPNSVTADWNGTPMAKQGSSQAGTGGWGEAFIFILQNPAAGSFNVNFANGNGSNQFACTIVGFDESVTIVSDGGANFTAPGGISAFDNTISSITTVSGDVIISEISDDGGTNELAAPGPTFTGGTVYATQATGGGDSWSGAANIIASGTSTSITWRYGSHGGPFGDLAVKYVVLRDASTPPPNPLARAYGPDGQRVNTGLRR